MKIMIGQLEHESVITLLTQHLEDMNATSPPDSVHALDVSRLRAPEVTFWTAWHGDVLLGCAALKQLDDTHGELKSMRTSDQARKQGVASRLLVHVLDYSRDIGLHRVSLETGSMAFFEPARRLYEKFGFHYCEPFAEYTPDPNSRFMTLTL